MKNEPELKHVSLATTYEIDNTFDSDKFIKMRVRVAHDGKNPNSSFFDVEDMGRAKESIYNIPLLANVIEDEDGNPQFGGHDMHIEDHKMQDDMKKLIYKETPIGVIPENCNHTIEKFNDKNYVYVDAYVWKGYSNYAQDIIERDNDIKVSMEILVDSYEYNAKEKYFKIKDYRYTGITMLNKDMGTGMENAMATIGEFAEDNSKEKFIIMMQELKDTLSQYNINHSEEGGVTLDEQIIALLEQYNLTIETVSFDIEGMSFEDLEAKLKEMHSAQTEEPVEEPVVEEPVVEPTPEKFVKSFELSHEDVRFALYQLLTPVENEDNEWYFIDQVFDNRFEYQNWGGTKIFRQGYKKDSEVVSLEGDRIELFQERLTKEEKDALDKMRGEFELLKTAYANLKSENESLAEFKLAKENAEKEEVFAKFEGLTEEDIAEIRTNISEYTLDVLEEKLFAIWGKKRMESEKGKSFSKKDKTDKKDKLVFSIVEGVNREDQNAPIYADIINKYKKN